MASESEEARDWRKVEKGMKDATTVEKAARRVREIVIDMTLASVWPSGIDAAGNDREHGQNVTVRASAGCIPAWVVKWELGNETTRGTSCK